MVTPAFAEEAVQQRHTTKLNTGRGYADYLVVELLRIDGHKYITTTILGEHTNIIHAESCECKKEKK
jgi:hypothetical protein